MILTMQMIQYSWKLKGPNSPSTGVHVGREGAWSRAALGGNRKSLVWKYGWQKPGFSGWWGQYSLEGGDSSGRVVVPQHMSLNS